ncbi:MAG: amino acid adenylation domain-containing protein [Bacteroidetes bacterium]|nr:amino acid adenylation domain-containing protein [Bacteroidota bacterium]
MSQYTGLEIAVIGMAGKFPGAGNVRSFWENLANGVESITALEEEAIIGEKGNRSGLDSPFYVKANSFVSGKEFFDAAFFGYRPEEAALMDPQIRLFHEICWQAIEDGGYNVETYADKIGLFAGGNANLSWQAFSAFENRNNEVDAFTGSLLRNINYLCSTVAYKLNLTGPVSFVNTACSTSLVAIQQACVSLLLRDCKMALAGGVTINNHTYEGYEYQEGMIYSRDGHCRPFDREASGTVGGEGCGVVLLKRLDDAIKDRDHIYAVIKGGAVNNDGHEKVSFTAPSANGQYKVIAKALKTSRVEPHTLSFIEAHGTGTSLGDPIEVDALNKILGKSKEPYCALGSLKSNVGHMDAAAGVGGFIKTALSLHHRQLTPTLHYQSPNPAIDFENSALYVNTVLKEWKHTDHPLRAGVSAFGIGGTNAHLILEEAPVRTASSPGQETLVMVFSAKSPDALQQQIRQFREYCISTPDLNLADAAYTLQTGRASFPYRKSFACNSREELIAALGAYEVPPTISPVSERKKKKIVFLFPGQGAQYSGMFEALYRDEPVFSNEVQQCISWVHDQLGTDLAPVLFPTGTQSALIHQTEYTQPCLFIVEYALARLLMHYGLQPDAMIGHSIGEYTAACISGIFTREQCLLLVMKRGQLMQQSAKGAMLSVVANTTEARSFLEKHPAVSLAAVNSSNAVVFAGASDSIEQLQQDVIAKGFTARLLNTSHAFHSASMDGILEAFTRMVQGVNANAPLIPVFSNLTGELLTAKEATDPAYWSRHLRETVRFSEGAGTIMKEEDILFIEAGPGRALAGFIRSHEKRKPAHIIINAGRHSQEEGVSDTKAFYRMLGEAWTAGAFVDWNNLYTAQQRNRIPLPAYCFLQVTYPVNVNMEQMLSQLGGKRTDQKAPAVKDWFYFPSWEMATFTTKDAEYKPAKTIVFHSGMQLPVNIVEKLKQLGGEIAVVTSGTAFDQSAPLCYQLNLHQPDTIVQLFRSLTQDNFMPDLFLYVAGEMKQHDSLPEEEDIAAEYYFFLQMIRIAMQQSGSVLRKIVLVTKDLHPVLDHSIQGVSSALLSGALKVLPQEYPSLSATHIDISTDSTTDEATATDACLEILSANTGQVISYRHGRKWERSFYKAKNVQAVRKPFIEKGVYLITGGLGMAGSLLAEHLIEEYRATVVLCGRTTIPALKDNTGTRGKLYQQWEKLQQLAKKNAAQVHYYSCNMASLTELTAVVTAAEKISGKIDGVFHTAGEKPGDEIHLCTEQSLAEIRNYFEAKTTGVHHLYRALENIPTGFVLLFSSIATQLGGIGFGAYAAANNYMDYFVAQRKSKGLCKNWLSIDLDGLDPEHDRAPVLIGKKELIDTITLAITCLQQGQVVISTRDLQTRVQNWINRAEPNESTDEQNAEILPADKRETLLQQIQDPVQDKMLRLWKLFFGKDTIGLQDDFFETGGDSLKALTILKRIQKTFDIDISIKDFYANATIASLCKKIQEQKGNVQEPDTDTENGLPNTPEKEVYQLSPAQLRMYFLQELENESTAYNLTHAVLLKGEISEEKINNVFNQLLQKHEILRTAIVTHEGEVRQRILKAISFELEEIPSKGNSPAEAITTFVRPFDLSQAPLIRAGVFRISSAEAILVVDMHHIVTDGISFKILIHDFIKAYSGEQLTEQRIQYKDYAEWRQTEALRSRMAAQRDFWIQEFSDEVSPLELPYDFPRPSIKSYDGTLFTCSISENLVKELRQYAAQQNTSLFMLLYAAYYVVLSKLANNTDIVVGTVTSGREHADLEQVMGMFVNTLPVRNFPEGELHFTAFLQQVKIKTLTAIDNQDFPYYELLDELQVVRDNGRNPLFDTLFVFENADAPVVELPGLSISGYQTGSTMAKFDLMLTAAEAAQGLDLTFEYCTALFKQETIAGFAAGYQRILQEIVLDAARPIYAIPVMSDSEEQHIASLLDYTKVNSPDHKAIVELFEEQVARTPAHIALSMGGEQLSYRELNEKAARLGVLLQQQGVKPDTLVGLLMEKSVNMVVAIMGILKAGAAYLPMDTAYPEDRIVYLLQDSNAAALITDADSKPVHAFKGAVIPFSETVLQQAEPAKLVRQYQPDHLAYVIYTSGTTGNPKGVMIENRNVVRLLFNESFQFDFNDRDVWTLFHSQCFDFSVWEIFGALLYGGRLVVIPKETARDSNLFAQLLADENVTVLNQTPGAFYQLQEEIFESGITKLSLRYVIFGGEALSPGKLQQWVNCFPVVRMINMFGITETTVHVTYKEIGAEEIARNISNVGKPIPTLAVYLLNEYQQLVPRGTIGEICVGGGGVARGYLNRPELNAVKFITNPFCKNERLYRSGDLGRITPEGDIEYLGRMDHQVKIRGHRIELGEIEHRLRSFPGVKEAIVLAPEMNGSKQLVAYFVAVAKPDITGLREYLQHQLPVYMVPAYFMQVPAIPLNVNGKVDRKKLPLPEATVENEYVAPETAEERLLADIWEKVLGLTKAGVTDNFFAAGGDSIKSIQIIARIRTAGYALTVKDIFVSQTIRYLAGVMKPLRSVASQEMVSGEALLSPVQEWFFGTPRPNYHHFNQSVLLRFNEDISAAWIQQIFKQLTSHHDALRMVFKQDITGWKAKYNDTTATLYTLDTQDLSDEADPLAVMQLHCERIQQSINLHEGPLVKLALFRLGEQGNRLLIVIHHLVIDGISWRILFEDIQTLYNGLKRNEALRLPPKTDSYQRWTSGIREYIKTEAYKEGLTYWKEILNEPSASIPVLTTQRGTLHDLNGESFELSTDVTSRLLKEANQAFNTNINDLLLVSLLQTLHELYRLPSAAIVMEGHGREEVVGDTVVDRTIGWFTNLFPFTMRLPVPDDSLAGWVRYVKEAYRGIPNKGMDYLLAAFVQKEIKPAEAEICFNYLGQFDADISGEDFVVADEFNGHNKSQESSAEYLLEFSSLISGGKFRLQLFYDSKRFDQLSVAALLSRYQHNLTAIIDYCCTCQRSVLSPSDLIFKKLTISQLDHLQEQAPVQNIYPLTPMQEGLLFQSLVNEESSAYFEQMTYCWEGKLDKQALIRTMQQLADRHEVLRTSFVHQGMSRPLQVVWKHREPVIRFIDLPEQDQASRSAAIVGYQLADRKEGFAISGTELLRLTVLRSAADKYHFIWSHHHILMDGWCMGVIVNDFAALYRQELTGTKALLKNTEPYAGYIEWLQKQDQSQSRTYWQHYLSGYENRIVFPGQKKKIAGNNKDQHSSMHIELGEQLTDAVKAISTQGGVTINMVMQALWGILLCKYNNTSDSVYGAVVSGRPPHIRGVEQMVGLFINTIPVRINYQQQDSFATLLARVKEDAMAGEPYHYHPLADIQSTSELKGELVNHILVFENYPLAEAMTSCDETVAPYTITDLEVFEQTNYDLSVMMIPGKSLRIILHYNEAVFDAAAIQRIAGHLSYLTEQFCREPERIVTTTPVITGEEKQELSRFNPAPVQYDTTTGIIELIEQQALLRPDFTAVQYRDQSLSYHTLNALADGLALQIQERVSIHPNDVIAVMTGPSAEMMVMLTAVLKLGCTYLSLSPDTPPARNKAVCNDADPRLLLLHSDTAATINPEDLPLPAARIIPVHLSSVTPAARPVSYNRLPPADSLIYLLYTSGTTGMPKGVEVRTSGILNMIHFYADAFNVVPGTRISQIANILFDASAFEMWPCLAKGGTLHIAPAEERMDVTLMENWLLDQQIQITFQPPAIAEMLLQKKSFLQEAHALTVMNVAGDVFNYTMQERLPFHLYNLYGPTEDSVWTTWKEVLPDAPTDSYSIGRPVANRQLYVLDNHLQLLPVGCTGQLFISGAGLAKGYLHNETLNAEKFIPNPYLPGQRMYRTGDLARWMPSGEIQFIGRADLQVKIRGFRIETGDIESALYAYDGIQQAAVVPLERNGHKYLVAYYTAVTLVNVNELKGALSLTLPAYMVPAFYVQMEKLPLNQSGKIDRKALPAPAPAKKVTAEPVPDNKVFQIVIEIWAAILGIEKEMISIRDNFFEIGGNSIKLMQMVNEINTQLNTSITVAAIFNYPYITRIAEYINGKNETNAQPVSGKEREKVKNTLNVLQKIRQKQ